MCCDTRESAFFCSATIAFLAASDAWEVWDILKYVDGKNEKEQENGKNLVEMYLKSPSNYVLQYIKNEKKIMKNIELLIDFWNENEFDFTTHKRILASEILKCIIKDGVDVTFEICYLRKCLNKIKEI